MFKLIQKGKPALFQGGFAISGKVFRSRQSVWGWTEWWMAFHPRKRRAQRVEAEDNSGLKFREDAPYFSPSE